ncbi:hypothetical protein [Lysobacter sp. F60174L2]|uniref:hypothetical protein n=1 Tax=Lysobacter sp. F60174L2 TaxID=3459295 RepID=UPI00403DCDC4
MSRSIPPADAVAGAPTEGPPYGYDEILPTEIAQELLAVAEKHYVRIPIPDGSSGLGEWLRRPFFVAAGADGVMQATVIWIVLAVVVAVFIFGLEVSSADGAEQSRHYFLTLTALTGLFTLTHPSRLAFLHIKPASVRAVAHRCELLASAGLGDLDACDRILTSSEKICGRRLTVLWFLPASCWGVALLLFQLAFSAPSPSVTMAVAFALVALLLAGVVASYSRAVWTVFGMASAVVELQRKRLAHSHTGS